MFIWNFLILTCTIYILAPQIIGFDGITKFGNEGDELFVSSICQPVKHIAEKCVEILTSQTDSIAPSVTLLPVDYRCGGTTKDAV